MIGPDQVYSLLSEIFENHIQAGGHFSYVTGSAKRGSYSFSKFSALVNHLSIIFLHITPNIRGVAILGPSFMVVQNLLVKLQDFK